MYSLIPYIYKEFFKGVLVYTPLVNTRMLNNTLNVSMHFRNSSLHKQIGRRKLCKINR